MFHKKFLFVESLQGIFIDILGLVLGYFHDIPNSDPLHGKGKETVIIINKFQVLFVCIELASFVAAGSVPNFAAAPAGSAPAAPVTSEDEPHSIVKRQGYVEIDILILK